jgi:3-hydroxybutyryl-CoA dehydrogenase
MGETAMPAARPQVLVLGAGLMGSGIAACAAAAGHAVGLLDVAPAAAQAGVERARRRADRVAERQPADAPSAPPAPIAPVTWDGAFDEVAVVVEAVVERLDVKDEVLRRAAAAVSGEAVLATNTSSLSVVALAEATGLGGRLLGLHFFSPADRSPLLEVVAGAWVADDVVARARAWGIGIGKQPIVVGDAPGFLVNRVARPLYLEAERLVEEGAEPAAVDAALRDAGFPVGPLEIVDRVGLDVHDAVTCEVHDKLGLARMAPVPVVRRLLGAGRLGVKRGCGFHRYAEGRRVEEPSPAVADAQRRAIVARVLACFVNEAMHVVGEGYADAETIERAMPLALGHPVGPLGWMERLGGPAAVVATLAELRATRGAAYEPAAALLADPPTIRAASST